MTAKRWAGRFEELILREYGRIGPRSLCVIALSPDGSAVCLAHLEEWLKQFQNVLYAVGKAILKNKHGQRRRKRFDKRLELSIGSLRKSGAYGIRIGIGRGQLALDDQASFQKEVLQQIEQIFLDNTGSMEKETGTKIRGQLQPDSQYIDSIAVFWQGGGLVLDSVS